MTTGISTSKRFALYRGVSSLDKHQDPATQLKQLREHAAHRGFDVAGEFVDYASGRRNDRPEYVK